MSVWTSEETGWCTHRSDRGGKPSFKSLEFYSLINFTQMINRCFDRSFHQCAITALLILLTFQPTESIIFITISYADGDCWHGRSSTCYSSVQPLQTTVHLLSTFNTQQQFKVIYITHRSIKNTLKIQKQIKGSSKVRWMVSAGEIQSKVGKNRIFSTSSGSFFSCAVHRN